MTALEIHTALEGAKTPIGFVLSVGFILLSLSGLFSKAAADYGGVFGAAARAIERHKQRAIAADEASEAARLGRMEASIKRLEEAVGDLTEKDRIHHEYALYVAGYWRKLQFWAVEQGITLPPPPMLSYPEWKIIHYPKEKSAQ